MKYLLVCMVLSYSINSIAQQNRNNNIPKEEYGYIEGVRLDSINVKYAQVHLEFGSGIGTFPYLNKSDNANMYFVYGQIWNKKQDLKITDNTGWPIKFSSLSLARALNFLDYNGWKMVKLVGFELILEKK